MTPIGEQHRRSTDFPYDLLSLPMNTLHIDTSYQRPLKRSSVLKIVKNYQPALFDPIAVNMRDDGELYVIRGQHRRAAIQEMFGQDAKAPCMVFIGLNHEEEATVFYAEDLYRRRLNPNDRWSARLQAKDEVALAVEQCATSTGWHIDPNCGPKTSGCLRAIGALEQSYLKYGRVPLLDALEMIRDMNPDGPPPNALIHGVTHFIFLYRLDQPYNKRALLALLQKMTYHGLLSSAEARKRVDQCKPDVAVTKEIVQAYNKGKQEQNRLLPYDVKMMGSGHVTRNAFRSSGSAGPE